LVATPGRGADVGRWNEPLAHESRNVTDQLPDVMRRPRAGRRSTGAREGMTRLVRALEGQENALRTVAASGPRWFAHNAGRALPCTYLAGSAQDGW
jgi:hypothetical protein